jgi:capsid protein
MLGVLLMSAWLCSPIDVSTRGVLENRFTAAEIGQVYDANTQSTKRKSIAPNSRSEDWLLQQNGRVRLSSNARDLYRNFAIAGWCIRRHLEGVSRFNFHGKADDSGWNDEIEGFIEWKSLDYNFDQAGRHSRNMLVRLLEMHATIDGDSGLLKIQDGTVQGIEGDRVRNPPNAIDPTVWVHGIKVADGGKALAYSIHKRLPYGGFRFERTVSSSNMLWHGYYSRFDQYRGVSPIVAALNDFRDVYENFDLAKAKAKVSQLFAMAFYRTAEDAAGDVSEDPDDEGNPLKHSYKVDFAKGPTLLDLDPGDRAEILESKNPSSEFQNFGLMVIMAALKSLDIPFSFYDESHTNFFGSRGAWLHYKTTCEQKQQNLQKVLNRWTAWRVQLGIQDGEITLPRGKTLSDLNWEWVPRGMQWWDAAKEVTGDLKAMGAGLDNPYRICQERDRGTFEENIRMIAKAKKFAAGLGVELSFEANGIQKKATVPDAAK